MKKRYVSLMLMMCFLVQVASLVFPDEAEAASTWLWPFPTSKSVTSGFRTSDRPNHDGVDIGADVGDAIYAVNDGTIYSLYTGCTRYGGYGTSCKKAGVCSPNHGYCTASGDVSGFCNEGYGNGVCLKTSDGYYVQYAHMQSVNPALVEKQSVTKGTLLGYVGGSGCATGKHCHYAVAKDGEFSGFINPMSMNYTDSSTKPSDNFLGYVKSVSTNTAKIYAAIPKNTVTAAGYKVYLDNVLVKDVTDSNITSYNTDHLAWTVWNLDPFSKYSFRIWLTVGGKTYSSMEFAGKTTSESYPSLSISKVKERQVGIQMTIPTSVVTGAGYKVYNMSGELVKDVTDSSISSWKTDHLSWTIWSLEPGKDYKVSIWYKVSGQTYTSDMCRFSTAPIGVSDFSVLQSRNGEISLNWSAIYADSYQVMRSVNGGTMVQIATCPNVAEADMNSSQLSFKDPDTKIGNSYDYQIVTVKKDAGNSIVRTATSSVAAIIPCDFSKADTVFPVGTLEIRNEAYEGTKCSIVLLPDGLKSIGTRAFADCKRLTQIVIPNSVSSIADDAFSGVTNPIIYGAFGSMAQTWATGKGLTFYGYQE